MYVWYFMPVLLALLLQYSSDSNADVQNVHRIVAFKRQRRLSLFGFGASLAISRPSDNGLTNLFVGAPMYRTPGQKEDEPADGSLYKCVLNGKKPSNIACHHHIDLERRGGIGLSVHERDGRVLVCAPQFYFNCWNARIEQRQIGACYTVENGQSNAVLSSIDASCPAGELTLDIMFILDESASILHEDFNTTLIWITEVLRSFRRSIDKGNVHVGLVTFAVKSTVKLKLQHHTYKNFTDSVISIPHAFGEATKTPLGIKQGAIEFQKNLSRREVPKMMIVVTDGKADKGLEGDLADVAEKQRDGKVTMVAVGVGKDFSHEQLLSIAGKEENVLKVNSFKNLDSILDTLRQVIIESAITILEGANANATNDFAQCQQGISSHISEKNHVFLGAPGSYDRIGSVFSYERRGPTIFTIDSGFLNNKNISKSVGDLESLQDSYLGYSLSSGFFALSNTEFVVASMPRYNCIGSVFIYEPSHFPNQVQLNPPQGYQQLGCYFGHSVLAIDVDNDGLDDLLVSAPLYSKERGYDQGVVFVYMNSPNDPLSSMSNGHSSEVLSGSNFAGARFGMSITAAGDLDRNGYEDILIGAPLEDGDVGAVYKYFGSRNGFSNQYFERIPGKAFGGVQYFGYATAGGVDIDFNGYPDVVAAAPLSDSVIVLRSQPIVEIKARVETADNNTISIVKCLLEPEEDCVVFTLCISATQRQGQRVEIFDVLVNIDVDAERRLMEEKRLQLVRDKQRVIQATHKETCHAYVLVVNARPFRNLDDLETLSEDTVVVVKYSLVDEGKTSPMSAILDPLSMDHITHTWMVEPICSSDPCASYLNITASFSIPDSENPIIFYEASTLFSVNVTVSNFGPDISPFTTVKLEGTINPSNVVGSCVTKSSHNSNKGTILVIQNPLLPVKNIFEPQTKCNFILQYDSKFLTNDLRQNKLEIFGQVYSNSLTKPPTHGSSSFYFVRDVTYSLPLILAGNSVPRSVYYNHTEWSNIIWSLNDDAMGENKTNIVHQYTLINRTPLSPRILPLTFVWPSHTINGDELFYLVNFSCKPPPSCLCTSADKFLNRFGLPEINTTSSDYPLLVDTQTNYMIPENLNCENTNCSSFDCLVINLTAFSRLEITAVFKAWLPTLLDKNFSSSLFSSIVIDTSHLAVSDGRSSYRNEISTYITEYKTPVGEEQVQPRINIWIIIGSILGGLLLLILLVILVWKAGFFQSRYGKLLQAKKVERKALQQSVIE